MIKIMKVRLRGNEKSIIFTFYMSFHVFNVCISSYCFTCMDTIVVSPGLYIVGVVESSGVVSGGSVIGEREGVSIVHLTTDWSISKQTKT